jgi:hypothetical protein
MVADLLERRIGWFLRLHSGGGHVQVTSRNRASGGVKSRRKPASYELELHFDFTLKTGPIPKEMRSLHSLRIEEEHWWISTLDCTSPGAEEATGIQFCPSKFSYLQFVGK